MQIDERIDTMKQIIVDFDKFNWDLHSEVIDGVVLKHVVDNFFTTKKIVNFDGSIQETVYNEFLHAGGNLNMKFRPEEPWSTQWLNWHKRYQPQDFKLRHT